MRQKRQKITPTRRTYGGDYRTSGQKEPDILDIWEQQRRMREREAQLEREYEAAKRNLKDIKLRMRQNDSLLADSALLNTSFKENLSRLVKGFWLWLRKTLKKTGLRVEIGYIRARLMLGIPLRGRTNFTREKLAVLLIGIALVGGVFFLMRGGQPSATQQVNTQSVSQTADGEVPLNQTPEFAVLTPGGKDASQLGGFAKVSPPDSAPTYSYVDTVDGVLIRVSQQELPDALKNDSEFEKMAKGFNANRLLQAEENPAYVGQSISGPQSVVFKKNGLLILISSEGEISDESWRGYINSLKG